MPTTNSIVEPIAPSRGWLSTWTRDLHNRTVMFRAGNWVFTTYAFVAFAAFSIGFATLLWFCAMVGLDPAQMARLCVFVVVPVLLVGLRSFSIMLEWRELLRRPLATLIKPGYMLHGGVAGGVVGFYAVSVIAGVPLLRLLDAAAFMMPLAEAIARLGCYVYGCCWGRPTRSAFARRFGVRYTSKDAKVVRCAPHLTNVAIHPAQLYALVVHLAMFAAFYAALPVLPFDGALAGIYVIAHSVARYALEHFRQDDRGRLWGKLTHTNLYSLLMVGGGVLCLAVGAQSSARADIDLGTPFVHVIGDPTLLPWIALFGVVFGFAYGVHYKNVGSWISAPASPKDRSEPRQTR